MKKALFMAVAAIAAFSSCSNLDLVEDNNNSQELIFTASMEGSSTRATLDALTPNWEAGDEISINNKIYVAQGAGSTADFSAKSEPATGSAYEAYFPASLSSGILPAVQTYEEGKFNMPMYAQSSTKELEFKNICAVLAVKVTSEDIAELKSIKVSSNRAMHGEFSISSNKAELIEDGDESLDVVLMSETPVTLDAEGTTFYIAIPAQNYSYLNIFLSSDGTSYKQAMATRKVSGLGDIARNRIFNIDYVKNATQLWAGGVYFADYNVGVTDANPAGIGGYYCWGKTVDKDPSQTYNEGLEELAGTDDTATALWGGNWRMPIYNEMRDLWEKCSSSMESMNGKSGRMIVGKEEGYKTSTVFFPVGGYYNKTGLNNTLDGYYWYNGIWEKYPKLAGVLQVGDGKQSYTYTDRSDGCNVRAVLVE